MYIYIYTYMDRYINKYIHLHINKYIYFKFFLLSEYIIILTTASIAVCALIISMM
jgi:hypothetical protein